MLRVGREAGIDYTVDSRMSLQPLSQSLSVLAMLLHSQMQSFDSAKRQKRIERPGDGANCVLQVRQALTQAGV